MSATWLICHVTFLPTSYFTVHCKKRLAIL
jgi:hypothetical protein